MLNRLASCTNLLTNSMLNHLHLFAQPTSCTSTAPSAFPFKGRQGLQPPNRLPPLLTAPSCCGAAPANLVQGKPSQQRREAPGFFAHGVSGIRFRSGKPQGPFGSRSGRQSVLRTKPEAPCFAHTHEVCVEIGGPQADGIFHPLQALNNRVASGKHMMPALLSRILS